MDALKGSDRQGRNSFVFIFLKRWLVTGAFLGHMREIYVKIINLKPIEMAYMSQKGYDELVAKLQHMESVDRPAASAAIAEARDKGDLSENAEYDAAKEWKS